LIAAIGKQTRANIKKKLFKRPIWDQGEIGMGRRFSCVNTVTWPKDQANDDSYKRYAGCPYNGRENNSLRRPAHICRGDHAHSDAANRGK
jgi:hypothetical protein